ncbi:MAG: hypothetical protein LUE87_06445, partial [Lachnospiraceae bacterium]|nr:hypothetical protein [Lachnospiraceae bacterium]
MKKYIDADVLIERIEKNEDLSWNLDKVSQAAFISILNHIPAVDVEPVRKWIPCIERLPEKFEECIVAKADSKGTTG